MSPAPAGPASPGTRVPGGIQTGDIVRFHAPVAATIVSYSVAFNVLNSAMARTTNAAASLAAFAIAQGLIDLVAAPAGSANQWLVARGRDRASFRVGVGVMARIVAVVTAIIALVGWTPVGQFIYARLFGAPAHLIPSINSAVRVCVFMPTIWALRNGAQAVLVVRRQTKLMTAGVLIRLAYVWTAATLLVNYTHLDGALIGGILWISGISVEALFLYSVARIHLRSYPAGPEAGEPAATHRSVLVFLLPLVASGLLWALGKPLTTAAMARTADPEASIAAYQVAFQAGSLLLSVITEYRHAVVVLWTDDASLKVLTRFGMRLAGGIMALMLLLGLTGGAGWFLREIVGAPAALAATGGRLFVVLSVLALLWIQLEIFVGRMLRRGTTAVIGTAKVANMAAMILTVVVLTSIAPQLGPMVGALALVTSHAVELLAVWYLARIAVRRGLTRSAA